jgi:phosphosulfolactate synthase (CoM biosynthesis protein A)
MRPNNLIVFDKEDSLDTINLLNWHLGQTIDLVKITTIVVTERRIDEWLIRELVLEAKRNWANTYIGGWVLERAINAEKHWYLLEHFQKLWIDIVEFSSTGLWGIKSDEIARFVEYLKESFSRVLLEIWSKAEGVYTRDYKAWKQALDDAMLTQADEIILEWWVWKVWTYDRNGKVKTLLIAYLVNRFQEKGNNKKIILESIKLKAQSYLIWLFWPSIKIWNISPKYDWNWNWNLSSVNQKRSENLDYTSESLNRIFELIDLIFIICEENNIDPNYFFFNENYYNMDSNVQRVLLKIRRDISLLTRSSEVKWFFVPSDSVLAL